MTTKEARNLSKKITDEQVNVMLKEITDNRLRELLMTFSLKSLKQLDSGKRSHALELVIQGLTNEMIRREEEAETAEYNAAYSTDCLVEAQSRVNDMLTELTVPELEALAQDQYVKSLIVTGHTVFLHQLLAVTLHLVAEGRS